VLPEDIDELLGVYRLGSVAKEIHYVSYVFFVEPDSARLGHSIPRRHQSSNEQAAALVVEITYQ